MSFLPNCSDFKPLSYDSSCSAGSCSDGKITSGQAQLLETLSSSDFEPRPFAPAEDDLLSSTGTADDVAGVFLRLEELGMLNFSGGNPAKVNHNPEKLSSSEVPGLFDDNFLEQADSATHKTKSMASLASLTPDSQPSFVGNFSIMRSREKNSTVSGRAPPQHSARWGFMFEELVRWQCKNGHCQVRHSDPADTRLACWLKRQKYQYKLKMMNKPSSLSDDRQRMLEAVGVVWHAHEAAWLDKYYTLQAWFQRHGHSCVPSNDPDRSLAVWVKTQRRHAKQLRRGKPSPLSRRRQQLLSELSFDWNPRSLVL